MENRFNLVDEPWIPVADYGRVSLRDVFSNKNYRSLGGSPVEKIAVLKLLLAIAQSAITPKSDEQWLALGASELAEHCYDYLNRWHEKFFLFGDFPFLQIPKINAAKIQSFGAVVPQVSTGNTTVLSQINIARELDDAEKALLLLTQMGFALSGKKTDNSIILSPSYTGKRNDKGKPSTSKAGPSVAHMGLLHSFIMGEYLLETIWLNLVTSDEINQTNMFSYGVGNAPWEAMPTGEACDVAGRLRSSYLGRLIPLCRFCLLTENGLHYSEGIAHDNYKDGITDWSAAVNYSSKEPKALWVNPDKRPWRELTSLLSFVLQGDSQGFQSLQIRYSLNRAVRSAEVIHIWSGGLCVSSTAGEQFVSGGG